LELLVKTRVADLNQTFFTFMNFEKVKKLMIESDTSTADKRSQLLFNLFRLLMLFKTFFNVFLPGKLNKLAIRGYSFGLRFEEDTNFAKDTKRRSFEFVEEMVNDFNVFGLFRVVAFTVIGKDELAFADDK
jgi:hypothetical protein